MDQDYTDKLTPTQYQRWIVDFNREYYLGQRLPKDSLPLHSEEFWQPGTGNSLYDQNNHRNTDIMATPLWQRVGEITPEKEDEDVDSD